MMHLSSSSKAHVTVLLATFNGEHHLQEQLESIIGQSVGCPKIIASDDGSTDQTPNILKQYQVETLPGPRQGFAANFLHLINKTDLNSEFYAFADQDDVWQPDKLKRAIDWLSTRDPEQPSLYCSRTTLVNEQLVPMGESPLFHKPPSFLNALVQNVGGGNTMVFNRAALNTLRQTKNKEHIVAHDWWAYLLISGAGGSVFYDPIPQIYYRQHQANLIGCNRSWLSRFHRIKMMFRGRLKQWIDSNNKNLSDVVHLLTPEHQQQLAKFELTRQSPLIPRLINIVKLGIYRQTTFGQLGLIIATIFNKL